MNGSYSCWIRVDNYKEFLTVNELDDELRKFQRKDLIEINQIGKSQMDTLFYQPKLAMEKIPHWFLAFHTLMNP